VEVNELPSSYFREKKIVRPSPDRVLREKMKANKVVLVPVNSAMALVLKHNLRVEAPSIKELKVMICKKNSQVSNTE
jgi:Zn-dependent metalloprotease